MSCSRNCSIVIIFRSMYGQVPVYQELISFHIIKLYSRKKYLNKNNNVSYGIYIIRCIYRIDIIRYIKFMHYLIYKVYTLFNI